MKEIWKPIALRYEISNRGRVKSLFRGRILKPYTKANGYLSVHLGKQTCYVHRLVARAFIGPCPAGKEVNHRNGVKENNTPENLEYVTHAENAQHAARAGLMHRGVGSGCSSAKLTEIQVLEIRKRYSHWKGAELGREFGVSGPTIGQIVRRKSWTHI